MVEEDINGIAIDFSGVKPFEPLPEDQKYLCEVTEFKPGKSKADKDKMSLVLSVLQPEESAGRKLFREYSLDPKALPYLYQFIKAIDPEAVLDEDFVLKPAEYIGLQCSVTVKNEEFEEQIRSRVDKIKPAAVFEG